MLPFFLAVSFAKGQAGTPEEIFRKAVQLQASGRVQEAVEQYKAYLRLVPDRVEAISNLGAALVRLGRMEEAVQEYKLALARDPQNPGVRLNLALAYYKSSELPAAIEELLVLHDAFPDHLRVNELLADCYLRQGEHQKVIDLLTPLQARYPDERSITYMLGMALLREDKTAEGERMIDRLFRGGETAEVHLLLGMAKFRTSDFAGAKDEFARAIALNPKLPGVYSLYGNALRENGSGNMDDLAVDAYRKALEGDPNDFDANLYLGAKLRQDENYEEALKYLTHAVQVRPRSPAPLYQLAAARFGKGQIEQARKELESLVKDWPTFVEAHITLTSVYYRLGRKQDGDRESAIVRKLKADARPKAPAAEAPKP